ncbi:uncharacterized protein LOC144422180 [Styela clava]
MQVLNYCVAFAILLKTASFQKVCNGGDTETCICDRTDNSGTIDLTSIGNKVNKPWFSYVPSSMYPFQFMYSYNPCYEFTDCYYISGLSIVMIPGENPIPCMDVGVMNSSTFVEEENGQISLHYHSYDMQRKAVVFLECNSSSHENTFTQFGDEYALVFFTFKLNGPAACVISKQPDQRTPRIAGISM